MILWCSVSYVKCNILIEHINWHLKLIYESVIHLTLAEIVKELTYDKNLMDNNRGQEHIMNILRKQLLPYMTLDDIGRIDNAFINHTYRPQLLKKLKGVILFGDKDKAISLLAFEWLGRRQIYCVNMHLFIPIDYVYVGLSFRRLRLWH